MDWNGRKRTVLAVLALLFAGAAVVPRPTEGQSPPATAIQSESNQVLVPVVVYDTGKEGLVSPGADWRVSEKNLELVNMSDLKPGDFRLKQDGVEQKIDAVKFEPVPFWNYRDRSGYHSEAIGSGEGRWTTPAWNPSREAWVSWPPRYVLSYTPPDSPVGSCHALTVHVDRPSALVYAREKYCNMVHSPLDPLKGTKLGNQMERDLVAAKPGSFRIGLAATTLFSPSESHEVHITVEIPGRSLHPSPTQAILGVVRSEDGSFAARFSDDAALLPDQVPILYETQVSLSPGRYTLQVDFRDGRRFGRSEIPITVSNEPQTASAIGGIALCRQARIADSAVYETRSVRAEFFPNDPSEGFHALLGGGLECIPAAEPDFARGEPVSAYFEVYEPLLATMPREKIEAQVRISDAATGAVITPMLSLDLTPFVKRGGSIVHVVSQPFVNSLEPGRYQLEIQAVDSSGRRTGWGTADFRIE